MSHGVLSGNVPRSALALIAFATALVGSAVHAGPVITGTLVESNPTYDGRPGRLTIKPSDEEGANGFRIKFRIGPYKNTTTGEKLVIGSSRRFSIDLFARDPSSPGCATYASPLSPVGTGTTYKAVYVASEFQVPPLPGPVFPEYSAGTPVQICGDAVFGLGFGPYLGIIVGKDAD
jgi:hypothetical protein